MKLGYCLLALLIVFSDASAQAGRRSKGNGSRPGPTSHPAPRPSEAKADEAPFSKAGTLEAALKAAKGAAETAKTAVEEEEDKLRKATKVFNKNKVQDKTDVRSALEATQIALKELLRRLAAPPHRNKALENNSYVIRLQAVLARFNDLFQDPQQIDRVQLNRAIEDLIDIDERGMRRAFPELLIAEEDVGKGQIWRLSKKLEELEVIYNFTFRLNGAFPNAVTRATITPQELIALYVAFYQNEERGVTLMSALSPVLEARLTLLRLEAQNQAAQERVQALEERIPIQQRPLLQTQPRAEVNHRENQTQSAAFQQEAQQTVSQQEAQQQDKQSLQRRLERGVVYWGILERGLAYWGVFLVARLWQNGYLSLSGGL